jgi:hypothetical protein
MFGYQFFTCGALVHRFASNLLNLCNRRNLWIFSSSGSELRETNGQPPIAYPRAAMIRCFTIPHPLT